MVYFCIEEFMNFAKSELYNVTPYGVIDFQSKIMKKKDKSEDYNNYYYLEVIVDRQVFDICKRAVCLQRCSLVSSCA